MWGHTDAWAESRRRAATYTKDDWKRIQAKQATLMRELAAAQAEGLAPDSVPVMDLAERHRDYLERWFYTCGYPMHRGLGALFTNDRRFAAYFAQFAPNLASYLCDAIHANAARHQS